MSKRSYPVWDYPSNTKPDNAGEIAAGAEPGRRHPAEPAEQSADAAKHNTGAAGNRSGKRAERPAEL